MDEPCTRIPLNDKAITKMRRFSLGNPRAIFQIQRINPTSQWGIYSLQIMKQKLYMSPLCVRNLFFCIFIKKKKYDILNRALTSRLKSLTMSVLLFSWQTTCWSSSHPSFLLCQMLVNKYYLVIKLSNFLIAKITNIRKKMLSLGKISYLC